MNQVGKYGLKSSVSILGPEEKGTALWVLQSNKVHDKLLPQSNLKGGVVQNVSQRETLPQANVWNLLKALEMDFKILTHKPTLN